MDLVEHQGKQLLRNAGIAVPEGRVAYSASDCVAATAQLGPNVVVKAQIRAGRRGKSGGVRFAATPSDAREAGAALLGSVVNGLEVTSVLVEQRIDIDRELYAAVLNDSESKGPLLVFSTSGGMDIETVSEQTPKTVLRRPVDIRTGPRDTELHELLRRTDLPEGARSSVEAALAALYGLYRKFDAELVEINPLALARDGSVVALDAKVTLDPGARPRHTELYSGALDQMLDTMTTLERSAREEGLPLIELDGSVGVLANGAGLTMTTLDAINHFGGSPANFLEIGGDAYTKAAPALRLVLSNPNVRSLVVNFCGAFARTDVMTEGVVTALEELRPDVRVFFSIHGTEEEAAIAMVRERLGIEPYDRMDDAVQAAVAATSEVPA